MKLGADLIKDNLFPIFCVGCETEGEVWCENCRRQFVAPGILFCPICGLPSDNGKTHAACIKADFGLDGLAALAPYRDNSSLVILVKQLKYHLVIDDIKWVEEIIRQWLGFNLEKAREIFTDKTIIFLPLHSRRLRERGFNQAELVARALQIVLAERGIDVKINCKLERNRYTGAQAQLDDATRRKNMVEAFLWPKDIICPRAVVLVDDVYTTGATMSAAASALKRAGAREVWGFTLLRG